MNCTLTSPWLSMTKGVVVLRIDEFLSPARRDAFPEAGCVHQRQCCCCDRARGDCRRCRCRGGGATRKSRGASATSDELAIGAGAEVGVKRRLRKVLSWVMSDGRTQLLLPLTNSYQAAV